MGENFIALNHVRRLSVRLALARKGFPEAGTGWVAASAIFILVGVVLRLRQFGSQLLIEDEWHAVHRIVEAGFTEIFLSFGLNDYSIPLALYDRALMGFFVLNEWAMKAPMLLSGVALLLLAPFVLPIARDAKVTVAWLGLLAVSPLLVYFAKTARPYALTSLATFVAVCAIWRWSRGESRRWLSVFVICSCLAGWLHPVTLAFCLAPIPYLLFAISREASGSNRRRRLAALLYAATATVAGLALLLGPPLVLNWHELSEKAGQDAVSIEGGFRAFMMLAGTGSTAVGAVFVAFAGIGAVALMREQRRWALYLAVIATIFCILVVMSGARWIKHPLVLSRYLLPVLPFLLLAVSTGAIALARRLAGNRGAWGVALGLPLVMLLSGPLSKSWAVPDQFFGHMRYQFDYDDAHNPYVGEAPPFPEFYRKLARLPANTMTVVETPWSHQSQFNPLVFYQEMHRQRVIIGMEEDLCGRRPPGPAGPGVVPPGASGIRLRNFVHLAPFLAGDTRGADYLIVHKVHWAVPADAQTAWPDMGRCVPPMSARWGVPAFEDARILVFAVSEKARSGLIAVR